MRYRAVLVALVACGGHPAPAGDDTSGLCAAIPTAESGDGTYYDADGTGNCSFDASPNDLMVAAMNGPDYANAAWCGACLSVTGPNGTITVRVVDQCPGCKHGDLDLSPQAFQQLAPLSAGRVPISWHEIDCNVTGPIAYRFKEGSNPYWTAIQIRNSRYPIAHVDYEDDMGNWQEIAREDYNYFVEPTGLGGGPYALRITDARGQIVEDDVAFAEATVVPGTSQFPACP